MGVAHRRICGLLWPRQALPIESDYRGQRTVRIAATVLGLLCGLSMLAGCARLAQPGSLPSDEERCAYAGGMWYSGLCRYRGQ